MSFLAKPAEGFVLGKFMPPHHGHLYLCEFARAYCQNLTILVCSLPDDPIPGELRFRWMTTLFPDCRVVWCSEVLPQEPPDHRDFWAIWREVVRRYAGTPDVVFASEEYGIRLAAELGARFVPVDRLRQVAPISGTEVRQNPFAAWRHLPPLVRSHFVKRVCLIGPESTGKSTLARALARRFDTVMVPEYGRIHTETFGLDVSAEDIRLIVQGHLASVAAARFQANRILIEDTDPVLSAVWSQFLTGDRDHWFDQYRDHADLYLLCDVDAPWIDDGTRYFPSSADRRRFMEACLGEAQSRGLEFGLVKGDWATREQSAIEMILQTFPNLERRG